MSIQNFPAALQPIIQTGMLAREFKEGLESRLTFRAIADRESFPNRIGETITKTRKGLKSPVTAPLSPTANTGFDNGLTPSGWAVEQYTLGINQYGDTIDLNMVTEGVGIASQFAANARTNGVQAMQSLDRIAQGVLLSGNGNDVGGYLGGNTRVRTTLGSPAASVAVDDIRGFARVLSSTGQVVPVSSGAPLLTVVGSNTYSVIGSTADGTNVSTAPGGVSGTLTFSGNVTVADATALNAVVGATSPLVLRPNGRLTTAGLISGDKLLMSTVLSAVATMRGNNVPDIGGNYNLYLDDQQMLGLFADPDFKLLYRGAYGSEAYRAGMVTEILGVRFIPTTEAPQQASLGAGAIHRAVLCGQGALIEGDYADMGHSDIAGRNALVESVDGVVMVTREPLDRLQQVIAQSWYWIGGFALPTDSTAKTNIIPTATNSYLKRGIVIESL